jgi:hypothetical protein
MGELIMCLERGDGVLLEVCSLGSPTYNVVPLCHYGVYRCQRCKLCFIPLKV